MQRGTKRWLAPSLLHSRPMCHCLRPAGSGGRPLQFRRLLPKRISLRPDMSRAHENTPALTPPRYRAIPPPQWLSASFLFYQFNRVYHPAGFARKHDRSGAFRRRFLRGRQRRRRGEDGASRQADFDARSVAVKAALKEAYLSAPAGFLRLLQSNVIREWRKEDPTFCAKLEACDEGEAFCDVSEFCRGSRD